MSASSFPLSEGTPPWQGTQVLSAREGIGGPRIEKGYSWQGGLRMDIRMYILTRERISHGNRQGAGGQVGQQPRRAPSQGRARKSRDAERRSTGDPRGKGAHCP